MSYVSVWKPVYDKIVNASTENRGNEVIGLLIGKLENDTLVINDSVTGEFSGEPHRVVLNPVTIAKIADDFLKGRLKGNIVGWYHSHTEDGLFFSQTDVETQKRFQQFSRLTLGMVVDATNGYVGFFRINASGNAVRIPQDRIRVHERTETPQLSISPTVPRRQPRGLTKKLGAGVGLIALVVISIALLGSILYRTSSPAFPSIAPNSPILTTVAGSSIPITANATGLVDMKLFYALDGGSFTQVSMTSDKPGVFQYTIPGSQVTSNLTYYMEGTSGSSVRITTKPYQVRVSDFTLHLNERITVYRNSTKPTITKLNLTSINEFSNSVTLSTNELPNTMTVSFPATQIPGISLNVSIAADANTPLQTFPLFISASYASPNSQTITRTSRIMVTVTDFNMDVSPSTLSTDPNGQASLTVNVTLGQGFAAPIRLTFAGLPEGAKIQLVPSTNTIQLTGLSNMSFNLQVTAMKQGTYTVILTALAVLQNGDFISHSQIIQLTVR